MKKKETFVDLGGSKFGILTEYDNTPYLERNEQLRSAGIGKNDMLSDSWYVGDIPMHVLAQWMKEEGVSWEDHDGMQRLIIKKLNDPDFKKLRIVEGRI
jgi:hypothetical protein